MSLSEGETELAVESDELDETGAEPAVAARVPQFFKLFRPLLEVLADGADWNVPAASELVADRLGLDDEARAITLASAACSS